MGYYNRVLGKQNPDIHITALVDALKADGLIARIAYDLSEQPNKWTRLNITNEKGELLAQIERNPVTEGELGQKELNEFKEEIQGCKPASAAKWLTMYFEKVKVIYAFQLTNAAFEGGNHEIIGSIQSRIWNKTGGILQADNEGFSNEDGCHILWQFSENVKGEWTCAVRNWLGQWKKFTMDLGDLTQRSEFQNGKVPKNSKYNRNLSISRPS